MEFTLFSLCSRTDSNEKNDMIPKEKNFKIASNINLLTIIEKIEFKLKQYLSEVAIILYKAAALHVGQQNLPVALSTSV